MLRPQICNHLAREVDQLQAQAQPALEELTHNADQPTLERVRRIKTWHQRLLGRVKLVRCFCSTQAGWMRWMKQVCKQQGLELQGQWQLEVVLAKGKWADAACRQAGCLARAGLYQPLTFNAFFPELPAYRCGRY